MKIKIVFLLTACKKSGPVQQMLNIIKNLERNEYDPYLVTLYTEPEDSQLGKFLPYVQHYFVPSGKLELLSGRTQKLVRLLEQICPDVIHSLGVFPDFAVSRMKRWKHIITLRNYIYEDYPAKYGKVKGTILAQLHSYAMQHTTKTLTCSESLSKIYEEKLHRQYDFIRNGVDLNEFSVPCRDEKLEIRYKLGLPISSYIFVYTGQMIERKNVIFLLETFSRIVCHDNMYLLLLGDGPMLEELKRKYNSKKFFDFRGNVENVSHYLKACDVYVSTSLSEGLPNGVLEAMATGLPVVLSDIEQHQEIWKTNYQIGYCYKQGNSNDLAEKLLLVQENGEEMGKAAYKCVHEYFSAERMSMEYQYLYNHL